ncbi:MAG: glycine cleavage system aminomethyltransferase GcvT [Sphaerochaetaceae bacterium]
MKTVLYEEYAYEKGVKLIDFGGWQMPLHFENGIIEEHHAVRTKAGLFDVSHMGRCLLEGPQAEPFLDLVLTNTVSEMEDGQLLYSFMCYPNGTVVDDVIVYRLEKERYLMVMNAANTAKDLQWLSQENPYASQAPTIIDFTPHTAQIALQGPQAEAILSLLAPQVAALPFFNFLVDVNLKGVRTMVSRNGYTGEDGFELYCDYQMAPQLWRSLLEAGKGVELMRCGLGCRDSLRFEAKLPLYGHEISSDITPLEANLGYFVKFDKPDFCGKEALMKQKEEGIRRTLRGIEMVDPSVPRQGYEVYHKEQLVGVVTSGAKSPTLNRFLALVLFDRSIPLAFGDEVEVLIHSKRKRATIVKTPFYKKKSS